ncbi:hypothetical protein [Streptomyces youssoufiensis]
MSSGKAVTSERYVTQSCFLPRGKEDPSRPRSPTVPAGDLDYID